MEADLTVNNGTITAPTINATTALQINGTSTNTLYAAKPWVQCIVNIGWGILSGSSVGRVTLTITRTGAGSLDIAFTTHPNSFNYTHSIQVRADSGFATSVISNVSSGSCRVRLYNASQVLTDYQFSWIIFAWFTDSATKKHWINLPLQFVCKNVCGIYRFSF